jgi:hypothetical protein
MTKTKRIEPVKTLTCKECGVVFQHVGRCGARWCPECRKIKHNEASYRSMLKRGRIRNPGVGKGGAQWGEDNHMWKTGIGAYRRIGASGKDACELCGKVCEGSEGCVHHKDGDRTNNVVQNLMFVCKACHQNVCHATPRGEDGRYEKAEVKSRNEAGTPSDGQSEPKADGNASVRGNA